MPIYEYLCKKCGKCSELIVRSDTVPACEHCGSKQVEKQLSVFSAHASSSAAPACSGGCCGFDRGACGSGMCGGH